MGMSLSKYINVMNTEYFTNINYCTLVIKFI